MILVDTSIWVDHIREPHPTLIPLIAARDVIMHRLVIEELAMGHLPQRARTLEMMMRLPRLDMVRTTELISFIGREGLIGTGIGPNDAHLLASTLKSAARLWTGDKRLAAQARRLGCAWSPD